MDAEDLAFAQVNLLSCAHAFCLIEDEGCLQNHLMVLDAVYGVLRPLDLMQAYRLEMTQKVELPDGEVDDFAFTQCLVQARHCPRRSQQNWAAHWGARRPRPKLVAWCWSI